MRRSDTRVAHAVAYVLGCVTDGVCAALDGAGRSLGNLSTYDIAIPTGAASPLATNTRYLVGREPGESIVTVSFSRALWTGIGDPPRAEVKVIVGQ